MWSKYIIDASYEIHDSFSGFQADKFYKTKELKTFSL